MRAAEAPGRNIGSNARYLGYQRSIHTNQTPDYSTINQSINQSICWIPICTADIPNIHANLIAKDLGQLELYIGSDRWRVRVINEARDLLFDQSTRHAHRCVRGSSAVVIRGVGGIQCVGVAGRSVPQIQRMGQRIRGADVPLVGDISSHERGL